MADTPIGPDRPVKADSMRVARFAVAPLASVFIVTASACDGSSDGAAATDASAVPTTGNAPTTTSSSQRDTTQTTTGRDCPLPAEWERPPFEDVIGSDDQPDPDLARRMRAFGSDTDYPGGD
jgi:hypothetical protein